VLHELLDLVDPLGLEHVLLDGFHSDHETSHVFDKDVVSCNLKLILLERGGALRVNNSEAPLHPSILQLGKGLVLVEWTRSRFET